MAVRVLLFAGIREQLGRTEWQVDAAGSTVAELVQHWVAEHGETWSVLARPATRCAVNQVIVAPDTPLCDGDELAFFPPVTGG